MLPMVISTFVFNATAFVGSVCDSNSSLQGGNKKRDFPAFEDRYCGSGAFQEIGNNENRLLARYCHDGIQGIGYEEADYVKEQREIFFDYRPVETRELPAAEIWIRTNLTSGVKECLIPLFPIPNLFVREWWVQSATNLDYAGRCEIGGYLSDCWVGNHPQDITFPIFFCNLRESYPKFHPVVKQVGPFRFFEYKGQVQSPFPKDFAKPPKKLLETCKPNPLPF